MSNKAMAMNKKKKMATSAMAAATPVKANFHAGEAPSTRGLSSRDRKLALQRDVDKLRRKLRREEDVRRALERAFSRPLGALPRLPPYLPSHTLELLAEVAVLEEEVVRLEAQVVGFRHGLYQEAIFCSPKTGTHSAGDRHQVRDNCPHASPSSRPAVKQKPKKLGVRTAVSDQPEKENQLCRNSVRYPSQLAAKKASRDAKPVCRVADHTGEISRKSQPRQAFSGGPNQLSEELLNCLLDIYSQMYTLNVREGCVNDTGFHDPYGMSHFGNKNVGTYWHLRVVDARSFSPNFLLPGHSKLKALLRKLESVDLTGLTHQQKLAFWINIYNSCMMNAFLDHGVPSNPQSLVGLMTKSVVNVGGRKLSAMAVEHFILRLSYDTKDALRRDAASCGFLEWPEPLVTFALSCGSWSSPAVRVYTAAGIEEELERAKRDFLQAAVGISTPGSLAIPKILHWHLHDFAKDVGSLMDWISLQLPSEAQRDAVKLLENSRSSTGGLQVQVLPYDFRFRYLL